MSGRFHARDGWYFERTAQGAVRITIENGGVVLRRLTLDGDTWASAVAAVAREGETAETFETARKLHGWST